METPTLALASCRMEDGDKPTAELQGERYLLRSRGREQGERERGEPSASYSKESSSTGVHGELEMLEF